MSGEFRLAPQARSDLLDIWRYIARDDARAATRLLERFERKFMMASRQPAIGEARPDLMPSVRCVLEGRYVIFYRPIEGGDVPIEIIRIIHAARDIRPEWF
jgi:toxin ParE1/3/4